MTTVRGRRCVAPLDCVRTARDLLPFPNRRKVSPRETPSACQSRSPFMSLPAYCIRATRVRRLRLGCPLPTRRNILFFVSSRAISVRACPETDGNFAYPEKDGNAIAASWFERPTRQVVRSIDCTTPLDSIFPFLFSY